MADRSGERSYWNILFRQLYLSEIRLTFQITFFLHRANPIVCVWVHCSLHVERVFKGCDVLHNHHSFAMQEFFVSLPMRIVRHFSKAAMCMKWCD